uniref:Reverse transcriptase domain-containing protein n=1 Tax=Trichobilharzia regenti TaxID=157069 RepID=A0AA85J4Z6_TRIRE|nr:unnamed protein product [Trichobilharzia regenti]
MFADEFTEFAAPAFGNSLSIVCGDFNLCDHSFLTSLGHENLVKFNTRLDKSLDLVFINDRDVYETRRRAPLLNSDHCIIRILPKVYGKLQRKLFSHLTKKIHERSYSHDNILALRSMLHDTNWELFTDDKLDATVSNITDYLKFCLDICCPYETLFSRFDRISSLQLKKLRRQKEKLYKNCDNTGVRKINTLIKIEIERLNRLYNEKFLSCKNPSNIWKLFNKLTSKKQMSVDAYSDVNALNKSFIKKQINMVVPDVPSQENGHFQGFEEKDVLLCLKSLNPTHSLGPDGVPSILLQKCADILCHPLTQIFNASFKRETVPADWKEIKVVPVQKSSSGAGIKFRPVAITSPFLKTMEKLLLNILKPSLKAFSDPKQFAYKCGRSTLDAAIVLHHNIVSCLDKGAKFVRTAFLDYTAAFDSVPRTLLLGKMNSAQTESWATRWLSSYFKDRKQHTVLAGKRSTSQLTESGVPQGAVLSPFLFSFFLHDLPNSPEVNFIKYADDLTVSVPVVATSDCSYMNGFLAEVKDWSRSNGLKLNPTKCNTVDFSLRSEKDMHRLIQSHDCCSIDGTMIESKSNVSYLGISFSSNLCWSSHILIVSKKVFRLTYYIKKLRHSGITQSLIIQFINSCVLPIILYCSPLFFPGLLKKDHIILRRTLRAVSRVSAIPLTELNDTVVNRHMNSCKHLAKVILSDSEHPLYSQLFPCISSGKTRRNFINIYARTTKYKNSTVPYLARVLCEETNIRKELLQLLNQ